MRTSKKLLSFFLAVVMVITTCSVGFTAFAQDNSSSIWKTGCDADDAFTTLNGLADELPQLLMGIDALNAYIADPVYEKYAKADGKTAADLTDAEKTAIAQKATLQDVLGCLQPMLTGMLYSQSQDDFLKWLADKYPAYSAAAKKSYGFDYLNDNGDNALSFYQLIMLCDKYKSFDSSGTLAEWYDKLVELARLYPELYLQDQAENDIVEGIAEQIRGHVTLQPGGSTNADDYTWYNATLYDLKNFSFDFGDNAALVQGKIDQWNARCTAIGSPFKAADFGEYIYYAKGVGYTLSSHYVSEYFKSIKAAGDTITYKGTADIYGRGAVDYNITDEITLSNYSDLLRDATLEAAGCDNALDYLDPVPDYTDEINNLKTQREFASAKAAELTESYSNGKGGDTEGYEAQVEAIKTYYYEQAAAHKATYENSIVGASTTAIRRAQNTYRSNMNKLNKAVYNPNSDKPVATASSPYYVLTNPTKEFDDYIANGTLHTLMNASQLGTLNNKYAEEIAVVKNYPAYPAAGSFKPISVYDSEIAELEAKQEAANSGARSFTEEYAQSFMKMQADKFFAEQIIYNGSDRIGNSKYYQSILNGIVIENSNATTVADVDELAAAKMPEGKATCQLTDEEIVEFGTVISSTAGYLTSDYWIDGEQTMTEGSQAGKTFTLPESLLGTSVAKYFYAVDSTRTYETTEHRLGLYAAFKDNDKDAINKYYKEAYDYARSEAARDVMIATGLVSDVSFRNSSTGLYDIIDVESFTAAQQEKALAAIEANSGVVLTEEQEAVLKADYTTPLYDALGTVVLNQLLNDIIVNALTDPNLIGLGQSIEDMVNGLLVTKINLNDVVTDIWADLMKSPVETIINLLPTLTVLLDEVLAPILFNKSGDVYNGLLDGLCDVIGSANYGSYIGMSTICFDLNTILPNLMHWLMGDTDYAGITYWNNGADKTVMLQKKPLSGAAQIVVYNKSNVPTDADEVAAIFDHYAVEDANGNAIVRQGAEKAYSYVYLDKTYESFAAVFEDNAKAQFNCYFTYEGSVPHITGIYVADLALKDAEIADLNKIFAKLVDYETVKDKDGNAVKDEDGNEIKQLKKDDDGNPIASPSATANILAEVVTELATLFTASIDEFVADDSLVNAKKYDVQDQIIGNGLNNIFVAIPQLFDIMENLAADKYGIAKDAWTYCYKGKMVPREDHPDQLLNSDLEALKSFAISPNAVDTFDCFAGIFVEDWLNAIFSILNNVISTDNKISSNLPIISGLLNALGGFSEDSILTDVLNGVFQIEREDDDSFAFIKRANGLTGLSKNHAYFLLTNVGRLVEVIKKLSTSGGSVSGNSLISATTKKAASTAPTIKNAKANSKTYTKTELSNATDLINNLDKMLSSLLSDSTLNGFSLDSADNILAGVVSFFSNYLGRDCYTELARLVNEYTFYITGKDTHTANSKNDVDAKKVYTNDSMTGLMVETFLLIENIVENLFGEFTGTFTLENGKTANYNLITEAIEGVISPDAICVRLDGYDKVAKELTKYNCWHNAAATTSRGNYKISLDWGIKAGDKDAFFNALAASLRLVSSVFGVLLVDTGWYSSVVSPVLNAFCKPNGIKVDSAAEFAKLKNGYHDEALLGLIRPIAGWLDALLAKPVTTLIKSVQGIAGILDDKNGATIASIVKGAITPLAAEINGLGNIFGISSDKLLATSPTLKAMICGTTDKDGKKIPGLVDKIGAYANTKNIKIKGYSLSGSNLIPIVNKLLKGTGIQLKQISWRKLSTAKSPAAALVYVLDYLFETILDNKNLTAIAKLIDNDIVTMLVEAIKAGKIQSTDLLALINKVLEVTDSPTLVYWTFAQYLQELTESFVYPKGVTKQMADNGVTQLDTAISSVLSLLGSLGVDLGADDLQGIISKNLFTNKLLTSLATGLFGALDNADPTVKTILSQLGIVCSTKDIAKLLTDKSYGNTYSSAAKTIKAAKSWSDIKTINWGFKDGSAKAQQGFVNALAAILRPFTDVLEVFLNEGTLQLNDLLYELIMSVNVKKTTTTLSISEGDVPITAVITYSMKNGVFKLSVKESKDNRKYSLPSTLVLDLTSLKTTLSDVKLEGTNGYNSAIIPLLEALGCTNVKTYSQYQKDADKAKDNLLLDILNPLVGDSSKSFLNKLCANPVSELTKLLPNIAMYLDAHGLSQLLSNLLAPVTEIIYAAADTLKLDKTIENMLGMPLGDVVGMLLGMDAGDITLELSDLTTFNVEDLIIPIVNIIFISSDNTALNGLQLKNIDWNALISLGTKSTYQSKATGANGKYLTGKRVTNVDQGKVLVAVLRYVADTLVSNASSIKKLICGIDAIKKNDTIASIIKSVFNTIGTASPDQIVAALFYLLDGEPTNAFWDYTAYKTGSYKFSYPDGIDVDFLKSLPPMLDGLIGSLLDLNETIGNALFKDELVSKLAKGLYGAVEGVKVGDSTLTALLAQTDIDFSTGNVAALLVDKDYGQSYESAASVIKSAGSWANVNVDSLKWGVKDRDSFFHALVAVLRPIYGVLDVLLNDASLGIFDIVRIPGSNGYTSSIVPVLEAFSCYNIKTQYQYRQDIIKEYDAILLDIINPLWDKIEDLLSAPLQTLAAMVPNLALFIGNDGLCQIIDNLLTPVSALIDAVRPVVDLNDLLNALLPALGVDINGLMAKIGVTNFSLDLYDLNKTLRPLLSGDAIIPLINNILGMIDIKGTKLGIKLNDVDWLQLASHGKTIVGASQAATYGARIYVEGDSSETLIAVLRYLINTINTGDNFDNISNLIGGLIGGADDSISGVVNNVLAILTEGDTDDVIAALVDLLQTLA